MPTLCCTQMRVHVEKSVNVDLGPFWYIILKKKQESINFSSNISITQRWTFIKPHPNNLFKIMQQLFIGPTKTIINTVPVKYTNYMLFPIMLHLNSQGVKYIVQFNDVFLFRLHNCCTFLSVTILHCLWSNNLQ